MPLFGGLKRKGREMSGINLSKLGNIEKIKELERQLKNKDDEIESLESENTKLRYTLKKIRKYIYGVYNETLSQQDALNKIESKAKQALKQS